MKLTKLGSDYGGWTIPLDLLDKHSVVYSAGVGEDITFDEELIDRIGCIVIGIDPTPRAIEFVKEQTSITPGFMLLPQGLSNNCEIKRFYGPQDPSHVSHSIDNLQGTSDYFDAECITLTKLMDMCGDRHIDLLKMDIEGAEYDVIDNMLECGILPRILCVEFHGVSSEAQRRLLDALTNLYDVGYETVSVVGNDYTLVRE